MSTRTTYIQLWKPADSEVFDEQLNDNVNSDLTDAQVLVEHNLITAHTSAAAPHTGHAIYAANVFTGSQTVRVSADAVAALIDAPVLVSAGVQTGPRTAWRAHAFNTVDHYREFFWRARTTDNAGGGILELFTDVDGASASAVMSVDNTLLSTYYGIVRNVGAAAANDTFQSQVVGDTVPRFDVRADGQLQWGPGGSTARDTILARTGAAALALTGSLAISGGASVTGNVTLTGDVIVAAGNGFTTITATDSIVDQPGGLNGFVVQGVASAVNYLQVSNAIAGSPAIIQALGASVDIGITLTPKGAGVVSTSGTLSATTLSATTITASGVLTGATIVGTLTTAAQPNITSVGILAAPHFTSPVVNSGGLTVTLGGITVTGNSTLTGTLTGLTGLTVASGGLTVAGGGIAITGNSTLSGTLTGLTGLTVASGGLVITAGGLTVSLGGISVTGGSNIVGTLGGLTGVTSTGTSQFAILSTTGLLTASAGLTINGATSVVTGNFTVTSGTVGIGSAASGTVALTITTAVAQSQGISIAGTLQSGGTFGIGLAGSLTVQAGANSDGLYGILFQPSWLANGKTGLSTYAARLSAGAAPAGVLNNFSLYVDAPSGGSTNNISIYALGSQTYTTHEPASWALCVDGKSMLRGGMGFGFRATASATNLNPATDFYLQCTPVGTGQIVTLPYPSNTGQMFIVHAVGFAVTVTNQSGSGTFDKGVGGSASTTVAAGATTAFFADGSAWQVMWTY